MGKELAKTVYKGGQGEIVEKKSRFIATIIPIQNEEEALEFIQKMKKQYWDARHNCSAYVLGERYECMRCSDDGEPSQTAGRPMLDVLVNENIHDTAVVVTRYFGGVLLGTGGLVRAYQGAVKEGLTNCEIIQKQKGQKLVVTTDYTGLGKLEYYFREEDIAVLNTEYGADVDIELVISIDDKVKVTKDITEKTSGTALLDWGENVDFSAIDGKIVIF